MKKRLSIFILLICLVTNLAWSRTVTINLGAYAGKDVTTVLRSQLKQLSPTDLALITLSKEGAYFISGTVEARCSVKISGSGVKCRFILCNGNDKKGFKAFTDDTFLALLGTKEKPITVSISNLAIELQEHKGIWWLDGKKGIREEKFAVKIYHASKVNVQNIRSVLKNAFCTTFNLRVCSNISFKNCNLSNYNNCKSGGILWIEGATSNVDITGNVFNKYGNDEALGFYGAQEKIASNGINTNGSTAKKDIRITNNVFNYGYNGQDKQPITNDVLISFYTEGTKELPCQIENLTFSDNEINVSDPMRITLLFHAEDSDTQNGVEISKNRFKNQKGNPNNLSFYKTDIKIEDGSVNSAKSPIVVSNNTFINESALQTQWGSTGLSHFQLAKGYADVKKNKFDDRKAAQDKAGGIIAYITGSSSILLSENEAQGLAMVADISNMEPIDKVNFKANNNVLEGVTTIYCDKVKHLDIDFEGNTIKSHNMNFFLQEFASEGTIRFVGNSVTVSGGNGQLMTHWADSSLMSMKFHQLTVSDNSFFGVTGTQDMLKNIKNIDKKTIVRNTYYQSQ